MDFDPNLYVLFRAGVALLGLGELIFYAPFRSRIFGPIFDRRPWFARAWRRDAFLALWVASLLGLLFGFVPILSACGFALCARVAFVEARQANLLRGAGAVGLMPWFCSVYILLFELSFWAFGPANALTETVLDVARTHVGVILACAGICKCAAGYFRSEGFEYALANPFWSWHWRWVRHVRPAAWWILPMNLGLAVGEVVMGFALMVPSAAPLGAALAAFGYIGLFAVLKLLLLPLVFAALGILFSSPVLSAEWVGAAWPAAGALDPGFAWPAQVLLWSVLAVLVATKGVHYANYYFDVQAPAPVQRAAEKVALWGPELIWRVFTADLVDFFIRIHVQEEAGERTLLHEEALPEVSPRRSLDGLRFHHPVESIVLSSLFLPLKYGASHQPLFEERLQRYVRSLAEEFDVEALAWRFEYVAIEKTAHGFDYVAAADVRVDCESGAIQIQERAEGRGLFARRFSRFVRDFGRFGNYVPVSEQAAPADGRS